MEIVTGAFGYIGKYITKRLLAQGKFVRTITTHPNKPNPFGSAVQAYPYNFERPDLLTKSLSGADALYNTYWIRFPYDSQTYESALTNTRALFQCAKKAGVKKIVHIGVTQASVDSDLPYYSGKAVQEQILSESGVPFSIVRPTLVFGKEDILVNNIAWLIRRSPLFPIFGSGEYRVQPVFVEDLAEIATNHADRPNNSTVDAIGPETFSFEEMVQLIKAEVKSRTRLVHWPAPVGIFCGKILSVFLGDVLLTRNELRGLMDELLTSTQQPNCRTKFSDWLRQNRDTIGDHYSSEVARHFRWTS